MIEKIEVFKDEKNQTSGKDTNDQIKFLVLLIIGFFYIDARNVINQNCNQHDKNVLWNKEHIKYATCEKQMNPPVAKRQKIVQGCNNQKENQKLNGVKKHRIIYL